MREGEDPMAVIRHQEEQVHMPCAFFIIEPNAVEEFGSDGRMAELVIASRNGANGDEKQ